MGAWGLGLFQSDHDYDMVSDLSDEAGLSKLEKEAKAKAKADAPKTPNGDTKATEGSEDSDEDSDIYYSMYAGLCSDVETVRKHLDSGVLTNMIDKYTATMNGSKWTEYLTPPGYRLVLIGACAMSLGCTLPESFTTLLKTIYTKSGLMRDAISQMKKALYGPNGAQAGVPYKFGSLGLEDTVNSGGAADEDRIFPESSGGNGGFTTLNCPSPGGLNLPRDVMDNLTAKIRAFREESTFPDGVCNGCGAHESKAGGTLLACAKCKKKRYCSKECQKKMWKVHKVVCEPATGGKEN